MEMTLAIIKPDAVKKNLVGAICQKIEASGLKIVACRMQHISNAQAKKFYAIHSERPFFGELVDFISSAPSVVMVLYGVNAVSKYRDLMGATNPKEALNGTIRNLYADSIGENAVHGSDSKENASIEIKQFFSTQEIYID